MAAEDYEKYRFYVLPTVGATVLVRLHPGKAWVLGEVTAQPHRSLPAGAEIWVVHPEDGLPYRARHVSRVGEALLHNREWPYGRGEYVWRWPKGVTTAPESAPVPEPEPEPVAVRTFMSDSERLAYYGTAQLPRKKWGS